MLTVERLREALNYDATTGVFTWRLTLHGRFPAGTRAGSVVVSAHSGYRWRAIGIDRSVYSEHRLAWLFVRGQWPSNCIDHINGDSTDNRLSNLRDVSHSENMQNRHKASCASGLMGASWDKQRRKWRATISVNGKNRYLGHFKDALSAHIAYVAAKNQRNIGGKHAH